MLRIMLSVLLSAQLRAGKELPPSEEPDWTAWETVDSQAVEKATLAWRDALRAKLSPDDTEDPATLIAKELRGWETLGYDTAAACAAGKKILRSSQSDLEFILRNRTCQVEFFDAGLQDLTSYCAFKAIGQYGEDALPYLYPMLNDKDPYVRRNAAFTLGLFLDDTTKPILLDMLLAKDVAAGGAAFALGELGATDAGGRITALLGSSEPITRFCAAHALGELGIRGALPDLKTASEAEKDWKVQQEMATAIREIQSRALPLGFGCRKLDPGELAVALEDAEKNPQIFSDVAEVTASASPREIPKLKKIRLKLLRDESEKYGLSAVFWVWTDAIKEVRKRR